MARPKRTNIRVEFDMYEWIRYYCEAREGISQPQALAEVWQLARHPEFSRLGAERVVCEAAAELADRRMAAAARERAEELRGKSMSYRAAA